MWHLSIDIETYSSVDIKKAGLYKYVQSPDFEILLFAFSWGDEPEQIIDLAQGEQIPPYIIDALRDPRVIKHAFNAAFEWYCLNKFFPSPIEQWRCTQIHGLYCGYPAGLGKVGEAIGIPQDKKKMGVGSSLIRTFCIPIKKPAKSNGYRTRTLPHHEPEKWELFKQYCIGDVVAEKEILRRLSVFPVPEQEWQLWQLDQRINARGIACDIELVEGALAVDQQITSELMTEAVQLSGLDNPKSVQQLKKWLSEEIGEEVDNLRKDTVSELIEGVEEGRAKRVLEIRQELSKTSVKKYQSMQTVACDDARVRGLLQFYGANRTGRWAGRLVQVHNLTKNKMDLELLKYARQLVREERIDMLKLIFGNVPDTLSQLIRTAFVASPGKVLNVADFNAIEARVIAWLAGEQWRLDVFASHGKIYEASASQMFGVPIESIGKDSDLRQKGKVSELALGYQGAAGALISMGALDMGLTEGELPEIVTRWRNANRRIVDLWYSFERAAIEVMETGQPVGVKGIIFARESHYGNGLDFFTIQLPSGRKLYYVEPTLAQNDFGKQALHYMGPDQKTGKWTKISTYGGKLVENVVQAIARDCLAVSLIKAEQAGFETVLHVHDEIGIESDRPEDLEKVLDLMAQPIDWAPGLPLKAAGFTTEFYMKD
ncbi:DNA polymerase [Paenibacillus motobuensis]|uniref:DNA polymerase n=1 Tax=Paenibacillus TaxID=44249 RepID=UPI00203E58D7|nr:MULTISPECIES: DNA polymerase [Paenibacillus]MCM3041691.1 DNA polymerase [Paenibacillus lutimineralis]MCM3648795.1 DNA polymerase [Paenibacillus motobuensis]